MRRTRLFIALAAAGFAAQASAQTPSNALASQWNTVCITAVAGTLLAVRCDETATSTAPDPNMIAAIGQRLEEIPGQARIATRDVSNPTGPSLPIGSGYGVAADFRQGYDGGLSMNLEGDIAAHWSLFLSGDIGQVERRASPNEAAFDADTGSLTAGVNWQPSQQWLLGLALNHVQESLDYRGTAGNVETRFSGVLASVSRNFGDHWSLDAYAGWLNGDYELEREINYTLPFAGSTVTVIGMADANPDASRRVYGVAANGQWSRKGWNHGLGFGYDLGETRIDSYTENGGSGLALIVPGRRIETRRGRIDYSLSRALSQNWGVWQPLLRVSWFQEFSNRRRQVTLRLAQDVAENAITFDTEDPDKGWGEIALGSVFVFTHGHSAFIQLQQRFGHAFLQERMLALGWRIEL